MNKHPISCAWIHHFFIMIMVATLVGCSTNDEQNDRIIIQQVIDVQLSVLESQPQQLEIAVSGMVSSAGWTSAILVPFEYIVPPADGIYEFTFYATPPIEPAENVITPIEARHSLNPLPENLKGVRVYAETNDIVVMLETTKPLPTPVPAIINEVIKVQLSIVPDQPAQLEISAQGTVTSAGWSKPTLIPYEYLLPPQDGIYDFTFYATPPDAPSATIITPIEISHRLNALPADLIGVRIHSETNSIVAMLEVTKPSQESVIINEITDVKLTLQNSTDPTLFVSAPTLVINVAGTVTSTGWSKETLVPHLYLTAPQDGIYEFTYYATPPVESSITVITPTNLTYTIDPMPDNLVGVRIYSTSNNVEAMIAVESPGPNQALIDSVYDVQLSLLESSPPQLDINASGSVVSAGWSSPQLVPYQYIQPPQDGIYDFGFYATPPAPDKVSGSVYLSINVSHHLSSIPENLKGVRIHSKNNQVITMLTTPPPRPIPAIIQSIVDVQVSMATDIPNQLNVYVKGIVNSGGWTQPTLIAFKYLLPPQDGIYDYTFYATPPDGPAAGAESTIEVLHRLGSVPADMKGIRIHASTNNIEALLTPTPTQTACEFVSGNTFKTADVYEGGLGPDGIDTRYYWSIVFTAGGGFSHYYSDVLATGSYYCDNTGFHMLDSTGNLYVPWDVSVDIQNQSVNIPVALGIDRFYFKETLNLIP